ncbi:MULTISPECIES: hypothetical protein [unclassified Methylobacterium]|uniref:hypothetical protein n=1 Tax=unclassified Methylobacterium TaxID=2615210 RepID=UPI0011C20471|nr:MULTISPECIES: hypothetical protein [unclassified Methylobacterium]QEE39815.1 hypothetical protein FVA80_13500 [Methylobacterium sp. WL1]TXN57341.1 hypothetical protein FV241_11810 [Methylobacterium sp. WL2]
METGEIIDMARKVATLSQGEVAFFEGSVRSIRAERALAEEERIAALRALSDHAAIDAVIERTVEYPERWDSTDVLEELRHAGFVREEPKQRISFVFPGGHSIEVFGTREDLGCVKDHLRDAVPGIACSKGA